MPTLISIPSEKENTSGANLKHQFGYYETTNSFYREDQEDALTWQTLTLKEITPKGESFPLSPNEIGHRLWTSYQVMDQEPFNAGTTASTTVYDGKGNLITATLADAAAFAVIYDIKGEAVGVVRLNSTTHKPGDDTERIRIEAAGGVVIYWSGVPRVNGELAVSRAIGDRMLKKYPDSELTMVCSEATIDITNVDQIVKQLNIKPEAIGKIQIISSCDGFTDAAENQTKEGHEQYLLKTLKKIKSAGTKSEAELSQLLVDAAKKDGSMDNISVAIQSITSKTPAILFGVYDGHGGTEASVYVAQNIGKEFTRQCTLSRQAYAQQDLSVNKKEEVYKRDNPISFAVVEDENSREYSVIVTQLRKLTEEYKKTVTEQTNPVLDELNKILGDETLTEKAKIKDFYMYLDREALAVVDASDQSPKKNIDVIKQDKSISAQNFLVGIAIILVTLATGILPGLIISGIVYAATGRSPIDLFKTKGKQFEKELDLVKRQDKLKGTFFESALAETKNKKHDPAPDKKKRGLW